eukprot:2526885-Rhodomonas_salina.5
MKLRERSANVARSAVVFPALFCRALLSRAFVTPSSVPSSARLSLAQPPAFTLPSSFSRLADPQLAILFRAPA